LFAKMKTELSAALVLSAGLLVASGYGVTLLRLTNESLPTEGILSALPESFYLGVALENLFVPMVVLSTLGVVGIAWAVKRAPAGNVPDTPFWLGFGAVLSVTALVLAHFTSPFDLTADRDYVIASVVWAIAGVGLTAVFGGFARWRLRSETKTATAPEGSATAGDQLLGGGARSCSRACSSPSVFSPSTRRSRIARCLRRFSIPASFNWLDVVGCVEPGVFKLRGEWPAVGTPRDCPSSDPTHRRAEFLGRCELSSTSGVDALERVSHVSDGAHQPVPDQPR